MLNIPRPEHNQSITLMLEADPQRSEWLILNKVYRPLLESTLAYSSSQILQMMEDKWGSPTNDPKLTPNQYRNISEAGLSTDRAIHLLRYIISGGGKPLLLTGDRRSVLCGLVTIYPLLIATYGYLSIPPGIPKLEYSCILHDFGEAHNSMLEFIHKELCITPFGTINIGNEVIENV